jgi:hypothetical protein
MPSSFVPDPPTNPRADGMPASFVPDQLTPRAQQASANAPVSAPPPTGFMANLLHKINPIPMVEGAASMLMHPLDAINAQRAFSSDERAKADEAWNSGKYLSAIGHKVNAVPLLGPAFAEGGEQISRGDYSGAAGSVLGLAATIEGPKVLKDFAAPKLAKWSTTRKAASMGKDYLRSTRDTMAALGVNADDVNAARPFLEDVHEQGVPIVGKEASGGAADQLVIAANIAVKKIEDHVSSVIQQFPDAVAPASDTAIMARVAKMPGFAESDYAAAQAVIAKYGLDKPKSLKEAEGLRQRLNAENRSTLEGTGVKQRTAVQTNAAYVARQEAANSLRDGIYNTLEKNGVEGIRDLRRGEGAVLRLRNAADPLTRGLRSDSTVARTGETSLLRRTAQRIAPMVGAGTGAAVSGGNPLVAAAGAEIARDVFGGAAKNLSRNALLERAFSQRFTSPPVMSTQGFRSTEGLYRPPLKLPSEPLSAVKKLEEAKKRTRKQGA